MVDNSSSDKNVYSPQHYCCEAGYEVIDVIENYQLGFHLGNTVKYILRAGKKDPSKRVEDLKKAKYYLDREIDNLSK